MKAVLVLLAVSFGAMAQTKTLEEIAPHFPTNAPITWAVRSNGVPLKLWIYRKLPATYSAAVVSNAFVIGGFELQRFPKRSNERFTIWGGDCESDPRPDYLVFEPKFSSLLCRRELHPVGSGETGEKALMRRAKEYAEELGVDRALIRTYRNESNSISFVRMVDGIPLMEDVEGFSVRFGGHGEVVGFDLCWPRLEPYEFAETVTPQQIIECIRRWKTVVMPRADESTYFERVATYAGAMALVITNVTSYYGEGRIGETPKEQDTPEFVWPMVKLGGVVKMQKTNDSVEIAVPILRLDLKRLGVVTSKNGESTRLARRPPEK